jgi:hypothetical protein
MVLEPFVNEALFIEPGRARTGRGPDSSLNGPTQHFLPQKTASKTDLYRLRNTLSSRSERLALVRPRSEDGRRQANGDRRMKAGGGGSDSIVPIRLSFRLDIEGWRFTGDASMTLPNQSPDRMTSSGFGLGFHAGFPGAARHRSRR